MIRQPPLVVESLLWPVAKIYGSLAAARAHAYDRGWFASERVGAPVLSIGNITAGGTGKTPLTSLLIEKISARGRRVGVVSRGYGGLEKGPIRVMNDGTAASAERFGDEPSWLAARHPDIPIYVGADRVAAARALRQHCQVDLVIADDAFQHRRLNREFDVVVIDATEPAWHYRSLPLGRLREEFSALKRAKVVFLTKTNLASDEMLKWVRSRLAKAESQFAFKVFEFESRLLGVVPLSGSATAPAARLPTETQGRKVILASGIGRPHTFRSLVEQNLGMHVCDHVVFADHQRYSSRDYEMIVQRARELGVSDIVVTEKDAGKLAGLAKALSLATPSPEFWVTRLETVAKSDLREFYDDVDRTLF